MTMTGLSTTDQLIRKLADGRFHSGPQLAAHIGISRAAVHKHIDKLEQLGLDVFRVSGKGYRLASPLQLLDEVQLQQAYQQAPLQLHHVVGSTHDILQQQVHQHALVPGTAVLSEMQTAGRGRRGRQWISPFASNLYVSMYWPLNDGLNAAMGLSVAVGLGLAQSLESQGITDVSVKWPNDVYIKGAKVAGILIELEGQPTGQGHALIGVGLNLVMPPNAAIDQQHTDVQSHLVEPLNRNEWASILLLSIYRAMEEYQQHGLAKQLTNWRRFDHFFQQPVRLLMGQHEILGIEQGIDENGALLVKQGNELKRYFGGEISLRAHHAVT